MSVNTSETGLPFLVMAYLLLHPDAELTRSDIERLFGEDAANRSYQRLRDAATNGLLVIERDYSQRSRPNVYRAGEALRRIRAKVSTDLSTA